MFALHRPLADLIAAPALAPIADELHTLRGGRGLFLSPCRLAHADGEEAAFAVHAGDDARGEILAFVTGAATSGEIVTALRDAQATAG